MKPEIIVVTGNIGSGKSTVINKIKEMNGSIDFFNFDDYTKELYQQDDVKKFLMSMFGTDNKAEISDKVFNNDAHQLGKSEMSTIMLETLNDFFFKRVEEKFSKLVNEARRHLVIEFPMFFEMMEKSEVFKLLRSKVKVIAVVCDNKIRRKRVKARDGFDGSKIDKIFRSQMEQTKKIEKSDYYIDTSLENCDIILNELLKTKFKKVFNVDKRQ